MHNIGGKFRVLGQFWSYFQNPFFLCIFLVTLSMNTVPDPVILIRMYYSPLDWDTVSVPFGLLVGHENINFLKAFYWS